MNYSDKETMDFPCPGCKRTIVTTYLEIYSKKEAKCRRCGSAYKFETASVSGFKHALNDVGKAQKRLEKSKAMLREKHEIIIKKH